MIKYFLALLYFLSTPLFFAQTPRETRAVWVSTNFRLDWPPRTTNEEEQKKTLAAIFSNIESKNLNTIYFQVRSNGTVLFRSSLEPFSSYITGTIGNFGSYDPLEFAIKEAHKRGLEIHAWVNTMRVFAGNDISIKNNSSHISQRHPDWVYRKYDDGSIWLNPGIPEVRDYLVNLINEIVQNYDVDGIQLDFIRYPLRSIGDKKSFELFGNNNSVSSWRRNNITKFISELNRRIKATNPQIKLGVTPIGIYKSIPNGRGMEGYSDTFQDTREWLKLGIIDYAVPQIYWNLHSNPKFATLVNDWVKKSYGRNIIVGVGAYKPEVLKEIEKEITITRSNNAAGVAFFRYSNIKNNNFSAFKTKTLPSQMPWIKKKQMLVYITLASQLEGDKVTLSFKINSDNLSNNGYFALYEESKKNKGGGMLVKVIPNYVSKINFSLSHPNMISYYYSVMQFNQLWNSSSRKSNLAKITIPKLENIEVGLSPFNKPIVIQENKKSIVLIYSTNNEEIFLYKNSVQSKKSFLSKHTINRGLNRIALSYNLNRFKGVIVKFADKNNLIRLSKTSKL